MIATHPGDYWEEAEPDGGLHAASSNTQRRRGRRAPLGPQIQEGHEVHKGPEGCKGEEMVVIRFVVS